MHNDGSVEELPSKVPHRRIKAGEHFRCVGPAGGGYGPASARDPAKVAADVADGLISAETANQDFQVILKPDGAVDHGSTESLRNHGKARQN